MVAGQDLQQATPAQLNRFVKDSGKTVHLSQGDFQVTYWEGSVSVSGSAADQSVEGVGYVEMTGYSKPLNLLE